MAAKIGPSNQIGVLATTVTKNITLTGEENPRLKLDIATYTSELTISNIEKIDGDIRANVRRRYPHFTPRRSKNSTSILLGSARRVAPW